MDEQTRGAKFWLKVFNELRNRGLLDILIAVVDGARGLPEAIEAVCSVAQIQTGIVHLIRNSLNLASWKDRKPLITAIKAIYQTVTAEAAAPALGAFAQSEGAQTRRRIFMSNDIAARLKGLKRPAIVNTWPELLAQSRHTDFEPERFMKRLLIGTRRAAGALERISNEDCTFPGSPLPEGRRLRAGTGRRSAGGETERAVAP